MSYVVICTISVPGGRRHVVTHRIEGAPESVTVADVRSALAESEHAPAMTEYGVFLANRRIVAESKIPDSATEPAGGVVAVDWAALTDTRRSVQLNVRVRPADRARWANAASSAGVSLASWIEATLNRATAGAE
jgi:hypothetical protein